MGGYLNLARRRDNPAFRLRHWEGKAAQKLRKKTDVRG